MKISIITTVYNSKNTIREAIESVLSQNYKNIEYIIVDAGSTDGTLEIITEYKDKISKISSESDSGIYDGLNRGVLLASGDVIGFLHANDLYENSEVIEKVVTVFKSEQADAVYGDLVYVNKENTNNIESKKIKEDPRTYLMPSELLGGLPHFEDANKSDNTIEKQDKNTETNPIDDGDKS